MVVAENEVFINCPYDDDYQKYLDVIIFVSLFFQFKPRLASERNDGGENRVDKILEQIIASKYSIHDLSRMKASRKNELFRMNMPFELGMSFAIKKIMPETERKMLLLESEKYSLQKSLSDLGGVDPKSHDGKCEQLVSILRSWFLENSQLKYRYKKNGSGYIWGAYLEYQSYLQALCENNGNSIHDQETTPVSEQIEIMETFITWYNEQYQVENTN